MSITINSVIEMREIGGPFAGGLFFGAWFIIKTWLFWLGLIIGSILSKLNSQKETETSKN